MILLVTIILFVCCASAEEYPLGDLSIDQLRQMITVINAEITSRPEWKETTVPAGTWVIGVDIPAGSYSISAKNALVQIWRKRKQDFSDNGLYFNEIVKSANSFGKIILEDGMVFDTNAPVIFAPAKTLGF